MPIRATARARLAPGRRARCCRVSRLPNAARRARAAGRTSHGCIAQDPGQERRAQQGGRVVSPRAPLPRHDDVDAVHAGEGDEAGGSRQGARGRFVPARGAGTRRRARKSGTARTSRLSHERRQLRTARQARSFRPRCSVLRARPAPPARRNGTGRTGGPPRREAPSHATSRMTERREGEERPLGSQRHLALGSGPRLGRGNARGGGDLLRGRVRSAPPQRQEADRGPEADVGKAGHAARPVAVERAELQGAGGARGHAGRRPAVHEPMMAERALPHHPVPRVEARRVVRAGPGAVAAADAAFGIDQHRAR